MIRTILFAALFLCVIAWLTMGGSWITALVSLVLLVVAVVAERHTPRRE
jgi:hypothetical protein